MIPTEKYKIKVKTVFVRRDRNKPLTHLSVYGSWTGWVLSRLCKEYKIRFISAYSDSKKFPSFLKNKVIDNGGELYPLKPNMMPILNSILNYTFIIY